MYYLSHIGTLCPCKPKQSYKKKLQVLPYNTRSHTKHNHSVKMFILFTFRSSCRVWGWETSRWPSWSSCWSELSSWWIIHWDLAAQFLWTAGLGPGDDSVVESTQPSKTHLYKKVIKHQYIKQLQLATTAILSLWPLKITFVWMKSQKHYFKEIVLFKVFILPKAQVGTFFLGASSSSVESSDRRSDMS